MSCKKYIGCDPGKSGAIVAISEEGDIETYFYPLIGKEYDLQSFLTIFENFDPKNVHIVIEDVKALQGPMKRGNWSLSRCKAFLEMACAALKIPYTLVHSKTWQKEMWQGVPKMKKANGSTDTKNMSLTAAKRLFPEEDFLPTKKYSKPHEGMVDAILMAEYCRRNFN